MGWNALPASYRIPESAPSLREAQEYCAQLARSHYENFSVVSVLLPRRLRQDFCNVYAFCRIADDLSDEVDDRQKALDFGAHELQACYAGTPRHPVFVALAQTVREFGIPQHEFSDLLIAFRQDQTITRFETFDHLLGYCKYSPNPVGHLVLYLGGYNDSERLQLSDCTCTALQLANFWQDVTVDYEKGRIYLPLEDLRRFGVSPEDIARRRATSQFLDLMRFEVEHAREWFARGF